MKKEDVLEKSRLAYKQSSKNDEGMVHAENQGYRKGVIVFALAVIFMAALELFNGDSRTLYAILSLTWIFLSTTAYEKYRFTKGKLYLITCIAGSAASILYLVNYALTTLR